MPRIAKKPEPGNILQEVSAGDARTRGPPVITADVGRGSVVSLANLDPTNGAHRFMLTSARNVIEAWRLVRRCGLPETSVKDKLPYWKSTEEEGWQQQVVLAPCMNKAIHAKKSADSYQPDTADRRKPRFRTHAPGLPEVLLANVLLIWFCIHAKP